MFCSNCGKEIEENISFCPCCGHKIQDKENKTDGTRNEENINREVDYSQINLQYNNLKKDKIVAYMLLLIAGASGAHRFYSGNYIYCWVIFIFTLIWIFTKTPNPVPILLIIDLFALNNAIDDYNKNLLSDLETAKKENKFADLQKSGCFPVIAYTIITGIIIWSLIIVNISHEMGRS